MFGLILLLLGSLVLNAVHVRIISDLRRELKYSTPQRDSNGRFQKKA